MLAASGSVRSYQFYSVERLYLRIVTAILSGFHTPSVSSSVGFPCSEGRDLMEPSHLELYKVSLCVVFGNGSLYVFPSTTGESHLENDRIRHRFVSREKISLGVILLLLLFR